MPVKINTTNGHYLLGGKITFKLYMGQSVEWLVLTISLLSVLVAQSCPTLRPPGQGYWSGLPFPSPGDLPNPGIEARSPRLQVDSLPVEPPGKPLIKEGKNKSAR